jgi:hypothetical protein
LFDLRKRTFDSEAISCAPAQSRRPLFSRNQGSLEPATFVFGHLGDFVEVLVIGKARESGYAAPPPTSSATSAS